MKIAVFGATGGTGLKILDQALRQGHEVTAFARNPSRLKIEDKNLRVVQGDVLDPVSVEAAVEAQEAVLCALGVKTLGKTIVLSEGTKNIIQAMNKFGVKRLVCLSSAGVFGKDTSFLGRLLFMVMRGIRDDKRRQLAELEKSNLDWVLVRPARMTNGPLTGKYQVDLDRTPGSSISRADVADFMLKQVSDNRYLRKMPTLAAS